MTKHDYLRRLEAEHYRGEAWVHWTLTIKERKTGWKGTAFFYRFREQLTHSAFRCRFACPIFCLMPDHIHLLWCGLTEETDQLNAMKLFRRDVNSDLRKIGFCLQKQPYDNVLQDEELERDAIETLIEYIARNPERAGLVPPDHFADYPHTGCLIPGFPHLKLFRETGFDDIWKAIAKLKRTSVFQNLDPKYA